MSIERTISDLAPYWPGVLGVIPTPKSAEESDKTATILADKMLENLFISEQGGKAEANNGEEGKGKAKNDEGVGKR